MKVCCINPPIEDFYCTGVRRQPLGLLSVMAALREAGHEVEFINGHSPKKSVMALPAEFLYLAPCMNAAEEALQFPFKQYCHFGLSFQEIDRRIGASRASVFFISSLFTPYHDEHAAIAAMIRRHKPGAPIIAGGYHAALHCEELLAAGAADYIVTGEGERAAVLLLEHLEGGITLSKVPNLCYRDHGEFFRTGWFLEPSLDVLPLPARDLLADRDFRFYRTRAVSLAASRGCPNRCDFCSSREFWGGRYRRRSAASVVHEIDHCGDRYGARVFNFEDDNLFAVKDAALELLEALARCRARHDGDMECTAMNGVSLEQVDEEVLAAMARAGFREMNLSLVTLSGDILAGHGRPFDAADFRQRAFDAKKIGMAVRAYFILGLPGQSNDEVNATLDFLRSMDVMVFPSVFYDVKRPRQEWKMQRSSAFYNESPLMTRADLLRHFNRAMAINRDRGRDRG
jgi:radical SAM superfamily enzyme YgiQ (UPF0313 family)